MRNYYGALMNELIGLTLEEAREQGYYIRQVQIDGEPQCVTMDYNPKRINVATENGKIVAVISKS